MKILVTGIKGQLGFDCMRELSARHIDCVGADRDEFDITDYEACERFITHHMPDVVIHCSAYTAVDRAEDEIDICRRVNVDGPHNIAKVCKQINAKMIYISTDYVFSGTGETFYAPENATSPCNVYGDSKLQGENAVREVLDKYFIVRSSWCFGIYGNNFIKTMLKLAKDRTELNVVDDQFGSPTYTKDLAILLVDMASSDKYGIYHATNEGICNWAEFAEAIFEAAGITHMTVNHVPSDQYPTKAVRPKNSRMSKDKLEKSGFNRLPTWQDALKRYIEELKNTKAL